MRKMMLTMLFADVMLSSFAKVHKFSPEFQATYDAASTPEVQEAQRKGAEAKVVYRVVDDEGSPLANQEIGYRWQNDYPRKTWGGYAMTDTNGVVVLQDKVGSQMTVGVRREGY